MKVVTRYAPSPTGNPHVGNIRTALFAYLFAKSQKGEFLLRIEDTDRARFVPEALKYIEESLDWLGIKYDGEKVFQSGRLMEYQKLAADLVKKNQAYKCFCNPEKLAKIRKEQEKKKIAPKYDRCCLDLSPQEVEKKEKAGEKYVIRFKMPDKGAATWHDLVKGDISIEYATQEDFIILKSDGWPTYNFANVLDDHEMGITHVIRGDEYIPSNPKYIRLYETFGWKVPEYAHLSLIVGPDKSKLSKRHGDTAILDYRDRGYLPEAMVNFLALLGWNDGTEDEIFTMDDLIKRFDISRVQKAPAVFDIEKLNWLNGIYIRKADNVYLQRIMGDLFPKATIIKQDNFDRILEVEKTRLTTLADILKGNEYFTKQPSSYKNILIFKKSTKEATKKGLTEAQGMFNGIKNWDKCSVSDFEEVLKKTVDRAKLTNGDVFWPVRVALSGVEKSPSPAELLWVLGKEESLKRAGKAIEVLK